MVTTLGSYVYGAYINFVMGGGEGGGSEINPSAQTGDFLMPVIFAVIALILLAAIVFLSITFIRKTDWFANSASKVGIIAKSMASKKIMIASIVAAAVIAIVAASFSAKAFADVNYENPTAPAYSFTTGTMDKSTGTISVPTVTIVDDAVKETGKYATIQAFSIKGLDQFANKDLGNWTVKIDDCLIYSGKMNVLKPCPFITKESGVLNIDISATDVPSDVMDALNGNMGVLLEFGNEKFLPVDKDGNLKATVNLINSSSAVGGEQKFSIADGREEEFNKLINDNGWKRIVDTDAYEKEFDYYTDYNDILSMWNNAIADGLLVNDNTFYKWKIENNKYNNILLDDDTFTPEWLPETQDVTFKYNLGIDVELTSYGQSVLNERGWQLKQEHSVGGEENPKYIEGTTTNLIDVSEINNVLTSECFTFQNGVFSGWAFNDGKIFECNDNSDVFENKAQLAPVTVILGGMVVDETGKGVPNLCVAFNPKGDSTNPSKLEAKQFGPRPIYSTITDVNGNYCLAVDKGLTGFMYFGASIFDNTDNTLSGKTLLLENVQAQNIPTIVVKQKATLLYDKQFEQDASNKQILDYGTTKFVNSKGEVFYQSSVNERTIEVCAHDSGKLIYESTMFYGELDIADTSEATEPVTLLIKPKNPETDSDCLVHGVAYLYETVDTKVPLKNAQLTFLIRDPERSEDRYLNVVTNENGEYSFKGFQGAYIVQVICTSSEGKEYSKHYGASMTYGDEYEFDVNFVAITNENI